jgi:hypothetical protein
VPADRPHGDPCPFFFVEPSSWNNTAAEAEGTGSAGGRMTRIDRADDDWACAASVPSTTEAHLLAGRLEAGGIPALVAGANFAGLYPCLTDELGGVRVLVPEPYRALAQRMIEAYARGDYALDDNADVGID